MKITQFIVDNTAHNLTIEFTESLDVKAKINDAQLSFEYLRISSPEASGQKNKSGVAQVTCHKKGVALINIESVAKHGYRLIFDDGHQAIYSDEYLQILTTEFDVRWPQYLADLKTSGHSREAMIDFKQL